jgi:hypothetical protein
MKTLRLVAIVLIIMAVVFQAFGGVTDILASQAITQRHVWSDSQFMILLAIALLGLSASA